VYLGIIHLFFWQTKGRQGKKKKWAELFCTAYNNSPCAHLMLGGGGGGSFLLSLTHPPMLECLAHPFLFSMQPMMAHQPLPLGRFLWQYWSQYAKVELLFLFCGEFGKESSSPIYTIPYLGSFNTKLYLFQKCWKFSKKKKDF